MFDKIEQAIGALEQAARELDPDTLEAKSALRLVERCARAEHLAAACKALAAKRVAQSGAWRRDGARSPAEWMAFTTGTSVGKAKDTIATAEVLGSSDDLSEALRHGEISLDQAADIAKAEESFTGAATELLAVAQEEAFHVLKEKARKARLEAEQHRDLAQRQRAARGARSYCDELGMVNIHLALEPHVGTPIVARAEAEAARLARAANRNGDKEPFEAYLADAYATLLSGSGKGRAKRPELVVLVSYEVTQRGWKDLRTGELCKIPGIGPVSPQVAKEIAQDAFLNGVFYDGVDLRNFARWSKHIPVEVAVALELGHPPAFDGVACVDCGNRFRTEFDHVEPRVARGPTSNGNIDPRCWTCHQEKTRRDRRAGKLKPADA